MAVKSDPEMGINSWLEDELYQQYLRDRSSVDEGWKQVFEEAGGVQSRARAAGPRPAPPRRPLQRPAAAARRAPGRR